MFAPNIFNCFTKQIIVMKTYNLAFLLLFLYPFASPITDSQPKQKKDKPRAANIVFKSTDGGQTWEDVSEGLPENLQVDGLQGEDFFANGSGLHLRAGNGIYHSTPNSTAPFWEKEIFPHEQIQISPGKTGIFAYNYNGQFLQKINGTSVWSPVYTNFQKNEVRTVFETAGGTVFIGCDYGLYKSADKGRSWKNVLNQGYVVVTDLVESEGVLIGAGRNGILRSTDDGEHWEWVISEGGLGKVVERIEGGFAVISYDPQTGFSKIRISLDSGKTWKAIDKGLPPSLYILSIKQMGEYLICGHADGIFRSSDMGKTWQLLLPSLGSKIFKLSVSGNVIYAIPGGPGC
jgi:photosystem II stability/assembly factor-like uncharacterized protein